MRASMRYIAIAWLAFSMSAVLPAVLPVVAGEISTGWYGSTAIQGYDAVAYHGNEGEPIKGDKTFTFEWKGAQWRFASQADRDLFAAEPNKYAPQYGGHCANAMSLDKKVNSNAKIWMLHGDKLYLFAAKAGRKRWHAAEENGAQDIAELIKVADENWLRLKDK